MTFIVVAPFAEVRRALREFSIGHVVSILGRSDALEWPNTGSRSVLRLTFDDVSYSSAGMIAPKKEAIYELIQFARGWSGHTNLLIHCRAGTSRSPAAAMIALASVPLLNTRPLLEKLICVKAYYRPNSTMLRFADELIVPSPGLIQIAKSKTVSGKVDDVEMAVIPLS